MQIAHGTNIRLERFEKENKNFERLSYNYDSIRGHTYNVLQPSSYIQRLLLAGKAISGYRCKLLLSKIYFCVPVKPANAGKLYYIEDIVNCLKTTFPKFRTESKYRRVNGKIKGISALNQSLPMKPAKKGIKIWVCSDSCTGCL